MKRFAFLGALGLMAFLGAAVAVILGLTAAAQPKVTFALAAGAAPQPFTYVALGDSWPSGAHCGNCRTFVGLYADGLATKTGRKIQFTNLSQTTIPGTQRG